ncbi:MAG: DNA/RNA nuclease SfsA [Geothermobacteraceae bacterium]
MYLPQPMLPGKLLRRYKRFFADVELEDGSIITAHTPNTGSMLQCAVAGHDVLVSPSDNPKRKLKYTLELIRVNGFWVDTNTQRANRLVEEGLRDGSILELAGGRVRPEFRFGTSRIDFLVERADERVLVEVKNVTLTDGQRTALFPDAVTSRGQKHLRELAEARKEGYRAVIFFLVQRGEADSFAPADAIDPEYGRLLREVTGQGVEVLAYRTRVSVKENRIGERVTVVL